MQKFDAYRGFYAFFQPISESSPIVNETPLNEYITKTENMTAMRNRTQSSLLTALIAAIFFISAPAFAEKVYKWVDEAGNIHYSDIKPNAQNVEDVKVRGSSSSASGGSDVLGKANAIDEQKSAELEKKAAEMQEETKKRETQAQCQAIQDNLNKMRDSSRVKVSENGELRYLTPEEIAERRKSYQEMYKAHCETL